MTSGQQALDELLEGILPGDNIVWRVDTIPDYRHHAAALCRSMAVEDAPAVYFRFAEHDPIVEELPGIRICRLHPEQGFERFIAEIFNEVEKNGRGGYYVFDCISGLAAVWKSDRMLGTFFQLTCPFLYRYETVSYFGMIRNYHSSYAEEKIFTTAQVVLDLLHSDDKYYLHPQKVLGRFSRSMFMIHQLKGERYHPLQESAEVARMISLLPQPWLDFSIKRHGYWTRTFLQAQDAVEEVRSGRAAPQSLHAHYDRLVEMIFTRDQLLLPLVRKYLKIEDLLKIKNRMIGTGLIGGKSAGMLLARAILKEEASHWNENLEEHDSFFIGSDIFYTYLVENNCWGVLRKQRDPDTVLEGAEEARQKMLNGVFPDDILQQFKEVLSYFGQTPIIVRSSSLLEDNYGNAFSGKYESVFCINQGALPQRLETFVNAVRHVYASTMSVEALIYRAHRGLLEEDEQMALLIQRVSGGFHGNYYFPKVAGVGFSFNPFVWNSRIDPAAGVLRIVFGLGTRAVDRHDDDYTRVVSLNEPALRPESGSSEMRKYSQRHVDVLDLAQSSERTIDFMELVEQAGLERLDLLVSRDPALERYLRQNGLPPRFTGFLSFEHLFDRTNFVVQMRELLQILEEAYSVPVDVEFTANLIDSETVQINVVQCRPFQVNRHNEKVNLPDEVPVDRCLFETSGPVIGLDRQLQLEKIIYVSPAAYARLGQQDRYEVARLIGKLTHSSDHSIPGKIMLLGPGRWGTSTPSLGVPVTFAEMNTVSIVAELALMHDNNIPDVSLGTHFFNDLVEADILYLAVRPGSDGTVFRPDLLLAAENRLSELYPEERKWEETVYLITLSAEGLPFQLQAAAASQRAICYAAGD